MVRYAIIPLCHHVIFNSFEINASAKDESVFTILPHCSALTDEQLLVKVIRCFFDFKVASYDRVEASFGCTIMTARGTLLQKDHLLMNQMNV